MALRDTLIAALVEDGEYNEAEARTVIDALTHDSVNLVKEDERNILNAIATALHKEAAFA